MKKTQIIVIALAFFFGVGIILSVPLLRNLTEDYVPMDGGPVLPVPGDRTGSDAGILRLSVATMWSPKETFIRYKRLGDRLGDLLGVDQTMVIRSSYREVREALEAGEVDVAIVCTGTYINIREEKTVEILVRPEFQEGFEYRGDIIVLDDSPFRNYRDLEGRTIALTDPESLTGCLVPCSLLLDNQLDPENFFGRVIFTGNHDRAVEAVISGLVDAAAVNELIYHSLCRERPRIRQQTRVLWQSESFGPPPVLVSRFIPKELQETLLGLFLSLHEDDEGFVILRDLGIKRFVVPNQDEYLTCRSLYQKIEDGGGCPWP